MLPVSIRLNPFKLDESISGKAIPWSPWGRWLEQRPSFTLDPLFHAGCYYVQDASAMYVGHIFRKALSKYGHKGMKVLDLCAAPGGKTTDIAASLRELYGDDFLLVSNEVMKDRVRVLCDNITLWGDPNILVCSLDPAVLGRLTGYFDIIVTDVPCSGEGMFRKDERAKKEFSEQTVQLCSSRQKRILADIWPSLKHKGILIYSTCTYQKCENDENLIWIAETLGGEIIAPENEFSQWGVELTEVGNLLKAGTVQGEGQWVGALVKTAECPFSNSNINSIKPLKYGIKKGEYKGAKFIPDSDYVLSYIYNHEYPEIEVNREQALEYLHHDALKFPNAQKGFNVICYNKHPLGIVNNIGSRCNNLHPSTRRIIMNIK